MKRTKRGRLTFDTVLLCSYKMAWTREGSNVTAAKHGKRKQHASLGERERESACVCVFVRAFFCLLKH